MISLHQSDDVIVTNLKDNSHIRLHRGSIHVEFGCGVDSKMQFLPESKEVVGVNQSRGSKCLSLLRLT